MALFQPTNITPDLKGGVKNGVVLNPSASTLTSVDVSWTVNGNSTMVAYQIDFYQNTAASTQTGTTGKITIAEPFSAKSTDGTVSRFTATVAYSLFSGAYAGTGTLEGKFKITQWWSADDYIEQRSLSVFRVAKMGIIGINAPVGYGGVWTFPGQFIGPYPSSTWGDVPLEWARWQVYLGSTSGELMWDTGIVYNATDITYSPPPLSPGYYYVVLTAQDANGATYKDMREIDVLHEGAATLNDLLTVKCDKGNDALKIYIENNVVPVPGTVNGTVNIGKNGRIVLSGGNARVDYDISPYSSDTWSFIWHGTIDGTTSATANLLFSVEFGALSQNISVMRQGNNLAFSPLGNGSTVPYAVGDEFVIIFTGGYFTDNDTTGYQWLVYKPNSSGYTNWAVTSYTLGVPKAIHLFGNSSVYGFQLGFGANNAALSVGMTDPTADVGFAGPRVEFPYNGNITAQWRPLGPGDTQGVLYRTDGISVYGAKMNIVGQFLPFIDATVSSYILDYSATNGTAYTYAVCGSDENLENTGLSYDDKKTAPCFWNWVLIEAHQDALAKTVYKVVNVFRFQGNVSTGTYTNRGARNIQPTFTPYPAVFRSTQNSRQGTMTGLIGRVTNGVYYDSNETEAALRALSSSRNQLFLRDRRGNLIKIALAGEISMTVNDATAQQEISVSIPWVETGSADGVSVYDAGYEEPEPEPDDLEA